MISKGLFVPMSVPAVVLFAVLRLHSAEFFLFSAQNANQTQAKRQSRHGDEDLKRQELKDSAEDAQDRS